MRAFLACLTAVAALSAPLAATAQEPTRAALESAMIQMFATEPVRIINFRGQDTDPNYYFMIRQVSRAWVTAACHLQLETPTILSNSPNVTPAGHYRFAWADVSELEHEGDTVIFHAAHMAADEVGGLVFESEELAEMFWAAMDFMIDDCS